MDTSIKKLIFAILMLFFLCLLLSSCKRNEGSEKKIAVKSDDTIESAVESTLIFGADRQKTPPPDTEITVAGGFTETQQGDIMGQVFPLISVGINPEDMIIGSLVDMDRLDNSSLSFVGSIIKFFVESRKGEISKDILHPSLSDSIIRLYKDSLFEISYSVRIGTIVNKNGIRMANIRLIGDKGRVSGSIVADNYEGKWLLSSISIDMNELMNVYLRENMEFNPISYSNILLNY